MVRPLPANPSKRLKNADAAEALRRFLEDLQSRENIADWQIQQAKEAIQLYTDHFHGGKKAGIALENAYDIRTIQELLGHQNLQTTMIYTHVAKKNVLDLRSPLDK